jgi:hypothetical protein
MSHTVRSETNAVLQEFGGILPEALCSFEDARREFLYAYQSELQKIGVADSNKTVKFAVLDVSAREGKLILNDCDSPADIIPAFVEYQETNTTDRQKVTIVDVEDIPAYEGQRVIAFYGDDPLRYRLAFDSWTHGTLYLYYDEVTNVNDLDDITTCGKENEISFPLQFWQLLSKRAAFNIINIVQLKLAFLGRPEEQAQTDYIMKALAGLEMKLAARISELDREFRRWINKSTNQQVYVRRSNIEIMARNYNNSGDAAFEGFE